MSYQEVERTGPEWACFECGFSGEGFHTVHHPAGDCDMECPECGSNRIDEREDVLRRLALDVDTLAAELTAAREEARRLREALEAQCDCCRGPMHAHAKELKLSALSTPTPVKGEKEET
jgi:predicted RNA-binding Zn-ribbon protein involved in translation (DUF1610 family)